MAGGIKSPVFWTSSPMYLMLAFCRQLADRTLSSRSSTVRHRFSLSFSAASSRGASTAAPALSSMLIYLLMASVLVVRPEGLFPAARR